MSDKYLKIILGLIIFGFLVVSLYCKYMTASANYNQAIKDAIAVEYPKAKFIKIIDREFEEKDDDVEFDVLIEMNGRQKEIELDCNCKCFGEFEAYCRVDKW